MKCMELVASTQTHKRQTLTIVLENCEKSAVKFSVEKPTLLIFVNLSIIFCQRFFSGHALLKLILRETELQRRTKFDIFQTTVVCTLATNGNLVLNVVPIAAGKFH